MARSKRILFTFDPRSHQNLRELTDTGGFPSASDAVRDALKVARALQDQARLGFTEVVVRNPVTNQEKVMVLPSSSLPPFADEQEQAEEITHPQFSPAEDVGGE
jgi:Arc/MetJ-type ribon-helix-helix transcriptional regulator